MTSRTTSAFPPVRKSLGQHFLHDQNVLNGIVEALNLNGSETVVEIGPGRGALTERLVPRCRRLVLVEYDRALAAALRAQYADVPSVEVVEADVLEVNLAKAAGGDFVLVGNVPYYITTPILFQALRRPRAQRSVFLVQREVAGRLAAAPGTRAYGALTVNVRAVAAVEQVMHVPARAFRPAPKVESAVIRLTPLAEPLVNADEEEKLRRLVQQCFSMRRKQMQRIVRSVLALDAARAETVLRAAQIVPSARPETLEPERFVALMRSVPNQL